MKLASVPKFDRTQFSKDELADLQAFADRCVKAKDEKASDAGDFADGDALRHCLS